jgi:hypothetical protein
LSRAGTADGVVLSHCGTAINPIFTLLSVSLREPAREISRAVSGCGVTRLSSLFEIPAQLAMLLSLAAATGGEGASAPNLSREPYTEPAIVTVEPLEGPLKYGEREWLQALYDNPEASGSYANRIFVTSGGRFYVPTADERRQILDARNDAPLAARVASISAERNAARLGAALQRPVSAADLYIAHLLGPGPAIAFLRAASDTPDMPVGQVFPALAEAVPGVNDKAQSSLTLGELYRRFSSSLREQPRLIAIGLKPSVKDAAPSAHAWHVEVDIAKVDRVTQ